MDLDALKKAVDVSAGKDRFHEDKLKVFGVIPLSSKVSAKDTGGGLYVFKRANMGKGGPPRHLHHEQDEWFYVIQGEFAAEVGNENFRLRPSDSLLASRKVAHVRAQGGDRPGTLR